MFFALALPFLLTVPAYCGTYSGGTGEPNNPYRIADANNMNEIGADSNDWDKHFVLVNDINLAEYNYDTAVICPDGNNQNWQYDETGFTGIFDGNNWSICNLHIDVNDVNNDYLGLFGCIESGGEVKNLRIRDVNIVGANGSGDIGGLAGYNKGSITSCYVTGSVNGWDTVAGLVGDNDGLIEDCIAEVSVQGLFDSEIIAGLVGENAADITNCYAFCNIEGKASLGGLVGYNYSAGKVTKCYAFGTIAGEHESIGVGGFVGGNAGTIENCYAQVDVCCGDSSQYIGGFAGYTYNSLAKCYAASPMSVGTSTLDTGGFAGGNNATVEDCFWDETIGGLDNGIGTALSTKKMKASISYVLANWDFVEIWDIGENQTYPFLRQYPAGDLNHDGIVNFPDFAIFAKDWLIGTQ